MLAADIAGPEGAQTIQLAIEFDPQPPFDSGAPLNGEGALSSTGRAIAITTRTKVAKSR